MANSCKPAGIESLLTYDHPRSPDLVATQVDQSHSIRRAAKDRSVAEAVAAFVAFGHEEREPSDRVGGDPVEVGRRVSMTEVAGPAAQEHVDVPHDVFDWQHQPGPVRDLTQSIASVLHCPARRPASKVRDVAPSWMTSAYPAVMEAEEVEPLASRA